ncbi:MAG: signal recognition particle receptor subunit alpha [Nitrososphaeria archaeon]
MLDQLTEGLKNAIKKLIYSDVVDERAIKEFVRNIQRALLQADVNVKIVFEITSRIEKEALKSGIPAGLSKRDFIVNLLYNELVNILGTENNIDLPKDRCNTLLLVGIQGSGKTTLAAKLGRYFLREGYRVGAVCADTYRPGAYEQLKTLCERGKVELFGKPEEKDAIRIAIEGKKHFERDKNIVIIDTAGRHKQEKELIQEMKEIDSKIRPQMVLLVIDGTIGQQSLAQAKAFHDATPIGGIIITKLDGAAKGGGAIAAAASTQARILFISTGEGLDDLERFVPERFVSRLLGLGDIKAILERVKQAEIESDEPRARRIMSGKMTIDDLYEQLIQLKKFGSIRKILDLLPGMPEIDHTIDTDELESKLEKWRFIIQSMTKEERTDPGILNASRIRRIARGSGVDEKEVKEMIKQYNNMKAVMKKTKGKLLRGFVR